MTDSSPLSSLNAQLLNHGWAKRPLNLDALDDRSRIDVVTAMFEMLGAHVSNIDLFEDLSARHRTLEYEHERLGRANTQAAAAQRRLESEVLGLKAKCGEAEKRLAIEETKGKELREEIVRGKKALEGVRTAASHEIRKVEQRLEAAQAKLARFSNEASMITRPQGLYLANPIANNRSVPAVVGQAPLLEQSLRDLAQVRQGLEEESEAFRHVLVSTANTLRETIAFADGKEPPSRMGSAQFFTSPPSRSLRTSRSVPSTYTHVAPSVTSHPGVADTRLKALVSDLRNRITDRIVHVHAGEAPTETPEEEEQRRRAEREVEKRRMDLEDRVKDLEVEIGVARGREEEAKKAMQEFVKRQQEESAKPGDDTAIREQEEIWKQKMALADQKRVFRAQMEKLEQERRRFETERQKFLDERKRIDVDDIVNLLPTTPSNSSGSAEPVAVSSAPSVASLSVSESSTSMSSSSSSSASSSSDSASSQVHASPARHARSAHMPHSPSPLSPAAHGGKIRTPKAHLAARRKSKTPLARLVLEKAVRQKVRDQAGPIDSANALTRPPVLGESTRRANAPVGTSSVSSRQFASSKGKSKPGSPTKGLSSSTSHSAASSSSSRLGGDGVKGSDASTSAKPASSLQQSLRRQALLSGSTAGGAAAAAQGKTLKVWR